MSNEDKLFILLFVLIFGGLALGGTLLGLVGAPNIALPGMGVCASGLFVFVVIIMLAGWMWTSS